MRQVRFRIRGAVLIGAILVASAGLKTGGSIAPPVKRALLIGIDTYLPPPEGTKARAVNLSGAVNDAEAMRAVLIARYGFKAENIRMLRNTEATRDRILSEIRTWLVKTPVRGDISFFFYAGHGSQAANSKSPEADGKDETIVPSEANRGRPDIRDKELKQLFNEAIDNGAVVTAIFDSCHSGSISRGLWTPRSTRFATPDPRDVADGEAVPAPENRGAVILSAAQDHQLTDEVEVPEEGNATHGVFTWALVKTMRSMPVGESVDRMFLRVHALMRTVSPAQEPVLAGSPERKRAALFGPGDPASSGTVVAVQSVADGLVVLQGGVAIGLRSGAELSPADGAAGPSLRVVKDQGLSSSVAQAIFGSAAGIAPGTLYTVTRWAPPAGQTLRVWIRPAQLTATQIAAEAQSLTPLAADPRIDWVTEPIGRTAGLSFLQRTDAGWQMVVSERAPIALDLSAPTPAQLASLLLPATNGALRVIADLPLSREAAAAFRAGASGNPLLQVQTAAAGADYALVGRVRNGGVEYAWVRPQIVDVKEATSVLPPDTEWIAGGTDPAALASRLRDLAIRLSVIKNWLDLESPPDAGKFPYHLALKHFATGALKTDGEVAPKEPYGLVLLRDSGIDPSRVERRFVYVVAIDQDGFSQVVFPRESGGNVENRLPIAIDKLEQLPIEIPLGQRDLLTFKDEAGLDTFVLLTTAVALPNPSALAGEAVRPSSRSLADPLTMLLVQGGTRGIRMTTPTDWSIERLTIKTRK